MLIPIPESAFQASEIEIHRGNPGLEELDRSTGTGHYQPQALGKFRGKAVASLRYETWSLIGFALTLVLTGSAAELMLSEPNESCKNAIR